MLNVKVFYNKGANFNHTLLVIIFVYAGISIQNSILAPGVCLFSV